nr:hypothetical protein [Tanacetum cinerariifolium]
MMRKHKSKRKQRKETEVPHTEPQTEEHIPTPSHDHYLVTNQVAEIEKLKKRVKKLEGKKKKRTHGLKRLYKVRLTARVESYEEQEGLGDQEDASKQERIDEIDADEDFSLINETAQDQGRMNDEYLFRVNDLEGDEEKDKGKEIMVEPKKPLKKKDQIAFNEEVVRKLDAQMKVKMEEEERIAREKDEANRAVIKEWYDVQATINVDRVYCVTTQNMVYYLLVEKMYPFTNYILHQLWKDVRLQVDYDIKMAYDLFRLIRRQINKDIYMHEVFGYILLMKTKILIKKLEDSEGEHQVYGRIVGIKGLHRVTTA